MTNKAQEKKDPKKKSVKIKDANKPSPSKPVAFVVPSIVIVPGTPHANRDPLKNKGEFFLEINSGLKN